MLAAGLNEDAVVFLGGFSYLFIVLIGISGHVIDVLWEICIDVLLVLAGFSAVRILLAVISQFTDP